MSLFLEFECYDISNVYIYEYRETALLYDPERSSVENKQKIALVIAHELGHQWFGNLVTMVEIFYLHLNKSYSVY